ncbi:tyrosine-type recombinase/integrase [Williamsia maris]|uniref:Site-specific recombinase XerD n=1 Tax=Williamsia maris TaxID=72806 RepID=A0ABT1HJN4_9NOCA|nr:tyrosine-type recombinase/integrase [Williamsia maris]MCP2178124.1 Site-specific recombinase XerD [Williamsia maris]
MSNVALDKPSQAFPVWFEQFMDDRQMRKLSPHSLKAYRQDFAAIAVLIAGSSEALSVEDITKASVGGAFSAFAREHAATSIRRCWSTWNVLCTFLFTSELLESNPMPLIGRPKLPKTLPKALPIRAIEALLVAITQPTVHRATDWPERDLVIVLTGLLAGLRAEELRSSDIGDIRTNGDGSGVISVRGKGGKHRNIPIEASYLDVLRIYLQTRARRNPMRRSRNADTDPLTWWPANAPLFVGRDDERISRGTLQSRIARAFKLAGPDAQPVAGALVHGLRHTFATELANANVNVYTLMELLGHESIITSQRYVAAAGVESRSAAATNPLYRFAEQAQLP